eukprot:m.307526 g.307526  ORF g.307526 m.307526 type:complete len:453 (+) comp16363_c0_seq3:2036-3394(+)
MATRIWQVCAGPGVDAGCGIVVWRARLLRLSHSLSLGLAGIRMCGSVYFLVWRPVHLVLGILGNRCFSIAMELSRVAERSGGGRWGGAPGSGAGGLGVVPAADQIGVPCSVWRGGPPLDNPDWVLGAVARPVVGDGHVLDRVQRVELDVAPFARPQVVVGPDVALRHRAVLDLLENPLAVHGHVGGDGAVGGGVLPPDRPRVVGHVRPHPNLIVSSVLVSGRPVGHVNPVHTPARCVLGGLDVVPNNGDPGALGRGLALGLGRPVQPVVAPPDNPDPAVHVDVVVGNRDVGGDLGPSDGDPDAVAVIVRERNGEAARRRRRRLCARCTPRSLGDPGKVDLGRRGLCGFCEEVVGDQRVGASGHGDGGGEAVRPLDRTGGRWRDRVLVHHVHQQVPEGHEHGRPCRPLGRRRPLERDRSAVRLDVDHPRDGAVDAGDAGVAPVREGEDGGGAQ